MKYDEDTLVQATTADYLRDELRWETVYAYNAETFGPEGTLGRKDDTEVVLTRYLGEALVKLNPGLPQEAYQAASGRSRKRLFRSLLLLINRDKYNLVRDGVLVPYRDEKGTSKKARSKSLRFRHAREQPLSRRARALGKGRHSTAGAPTLSASSMDCRYCLWS